MVRRGGTLLAVSVDSPEQSARVVERNKLAFPILSDADRAVIRAYGVVHAKGSPNGGDIALPSQFLIDRSGRIAWRSIAKRTNVRPDPSEILAQVRALN